MCSSASRPVVVPLLALLGVACAGGEPTPAAPGTQAGSSGTGGAGAHPSRLAAAARPDIVLVTIDTLRADRVGAYGDPLARTPTLDAIAARGALFREASSVAPTTLPSHASMLTGRVPRGHGARDNAGYAVSPDVVTVAEALGGAGWATGAFVSATVLDPATGIDQGFGTYSAPLAEGATSGGAAERPGAATVAAATAWWGAQQGPRFLWVHLYEPHRPWPDGPGDPYRADVAESDAQLAALLSGLGVGPDATPARPALLVVTADHGESLWEHGERDHGLLVTRAALRVPLLVLPPTPVAAGDRPPPRAEGPLALRRPPDLDPTLVLDPVPDAPRAALVIETVASGLDVAPTLADYAGVALPDVDGRSLRPAIEGGALPDAPAYAETWYPAVAFGWSPRCALVEGPLRWTGTATLAAVAGSGGGGDPGAAAAAAPPAPAAAAPPAPATVTNWQTDPGEIAPFADTGGFARRAATFGCAELPAGAAPAADPRLLALGYLSGAGELPDGDLEAVVALQRAEAERDPARARAAYEALLAAHPRLWRARIGLATSLAAGGDHAAALAQLDTPGLPESVGLHTERGALLLALGRLDEAVATAERLKTLAARDPAGWRLAARVALLRKDGDGVERAAREGLAVRSDDPALHYALGLALATRGADAEALEHYLAARSAGGTAKDLDLKIALLHERAGRYDEAAAAYAAHRAVHPDDLRGWAAPAWLYARLDRCAEAAPLAAEALARNPDDVRMRRVQAQCRRGRR